MHEDIVTLVRNELDRRRQTRLDTLRNAFVLSPLISGGLMYTFFQSGYESVYPAILTIGVTAILSLPVLLSLAHYVERTHGEGSIAEWLLRPREWNPCR